MKKIIQQGAEAIISLEKNQITKERISKSYRLPIIDKRLRKSRTKSEAKIINKLFGPNRYYRKSKPDLAEFHFWIGTEFRIG